MSRNKVDQPHPTPNPDGPHAQGAEAEAAMAALRQAAARLSRDSGTDEIPLSFLQPGLEPDPFLESHPLQEPTPPSAEVSPPPASLATAAQVVPVASAPPAADVTHANHPGDSPLAGFVIESPDPELFPADAIHVDQASTPSDSPRHAKPAQPYLDDVRFPWSLLFLLVYSTALTILLTWLVVSGRFRGSEMTPAAGQSDQSTGDAIPIEADAHAPEAAPPPIPKENTVELNGSIRLGDLEATPLEITADRVSLVRSIHSDEWRREGTKSLILRVRFTNRSPDVTFAPLHRSFLRDQPSSRWDRSEIATSGQKRFPMFPLAPDSEWMIEGQSLAPLAPGESTETLVASAPGILEELGDESTWRLRVRTGVYRSDMIGIRFRRDQVVRLPDAVPEERAEAVE